MNKFEQNLVKSDASIKQTRARIIASQAKSAQEKIIQGLKDKKDNLELELENLQDLSPTSTTSLVLAGGKDFDSTKWAQKLQEIKLALITNKVELDAAQATYDEWFKKEVSEA